MTNLEQLTEKEKRFIAVFRIVADALISEAGDPMVTPQELHAMFKAFCIVNKWKWRNRNLKSTARKYQNIYLCLKKIAWNIILKYLNPIPMIPAIPMIRILRLYAYENKMPFTNNLECIMRTYRHYIKVATQLN